MFCSHTRAPCARARQTRPQILTHLARARAARARTYAERRFGSPQTKRKQWYLRCFCNSEKGVFGECRKTKINIRMAKIQKRSILRCFFPFRCENFCFEKRSKHRNLQCFLLPPKTKQRYLRCFPSLATPK